MSTMSLQSEEKPIESNSSVETCTEKTCCDDCGDVVDKTDVNIKLINPEVDLGHDMGKFRDLLQENIFTQLESYGDSGVFNEEEVLQAIDDVNGELVKDNIGKISMKCDDFDELCDSCAISEGVVIGSKRKEIIEPVLREQDETEETSDESKQKSFIQSFIDEVNVLEISALTGLISMFFLTTSVSNIVPLANGLFFVMGLLLINFSRGEVL